MNINVDVLYSSLILMEKRGFADPVEVVEFMNNMFKSKINTGNNVMGNEIDPSFKVNYWDVQFIMDELLIIHGWQRSAPGWSKYEYKKIN